MDIRLKSLILLATALVLLAFPNRLLAGGGLGIRAGDTFQTKAISLENFKLGKNNQPAGMYSFKMVGKGTPGVVEVRILDSSGKEVGKTSGRFGGVCPGKPRITTFAELGYSKSSPVKAVKQNGVIGVTVECRQGSRIEFTLA